MRVESEQMMEAGLSNLATSINPPTRDSSLNVPPLPHNVIKDMRVLAAGSCGNTDQDRCGNGKQENYRRGEQCTNHSDQGYRYNSGRREESLTSVSDDSDDFTNHRGNDHRGNDRRNYARRGNYRRSNCHQDNSCDGYNRDQIDRYGSRSDNNNRHGESRRNDSSTNNAPAHTVQKHRPKVLEVSKPLLLFSNIFCLLILSVILSGTFQKTASGFQNAARHVQP